MSEQIAKLDNLMYRRQHRQAAEQIAGKGTIARGPECRGKTRSQTKQQAAR